jgi:hypothetical protein
MLDFAVCELVVKRTDCRAGIAENRADSLGFKAFYESLRNGYFL